MFIYICDQLITPNIMKENKITSYPNIAQSFGLIVILMLISIPAAIPVIVVTMLKDVLGEDTILKSLAQCISYAISFVWIIFIAKKKIRREGIWEIKWRTEKVDIRLLGGFILMTLALMILIEPLTKFIPMPESVVEFFEDMLQPNVFSFISVVILAPILEELFFRGIVLEGFLKNYSPWKAIVWSSIIFGVGHLNPWQAIGAAILGLLFGWAYVKTKSLIPGILMHFVNNLIAFCIMVFTHDSNFYISDFFANPLAYFFVFIGSLGIVIVVGLLIDKNMPALPISSETTITDCE